MELDRDFGLAGATVAARRLWRVFEPIHAVTYFAPEVGEAYSDLGLKGFWMGYFAGRSASLGEAPPALVTATFFNFRPSMVERALPDAWRFASPSAVLHARASSASAALQRLLGPAAGSADVEEAADLAEQAASAGAVDGRPLFAALAAVPRPADPLTRLWHATSLLREHRGDGHVAANLASRVDGLGSHVLQSASGVVPRQRLQAARGWTDDEWAAGERALVERGWVAADGSLTDAGTVGHDAIEQRTDELAAAPWLALGTDATRRLEALLAPLAAAVLGEHGVPEVSPIGDLRSPG